MVDAMSQSHERSSLSPMVSDPSEAAGVHVAS